MNQPQFGQKLKAMRVASGMTQTALAGNGMSTPYLSRLESGARPPTEKAVAYLAERLDVPLDAFAESEPGSTKTEGPRTEPVSLACALAAAASGQAHDLELLEEHVAADEGKNPFLDWQAQWMLADFKRKAGDHEAERGYLRQATGLSDRLALPELRVRARTRLARCLRALGDNEESRLLAAEALTIARAHGLTVADTAGTLLVLVSAEVESGRLADAEAHADELLAMVSDETGPLPVKALWTAATLRVRQGDPAEARSLLAQALERLDSREDLVLWVRLRLAAASLGLQLEPAETEAAAAWLDEATPAVHLIGAPQQRQELQALRAHLAFHEGRTADARALHDSLVDDQVLLSFRDRTRLAILHNRLLFHEGRPGEGAAGLRALAQQAQVSASLDLAAETWRILAECLSDQGGV
ncbi:helix-turn-helix domain-containing protein [Streptomyces sp. NPDC003247]|uniref:helix-turn-helix domain-containing protein n=1 Tax=Streptomyces sp. NPDC003247 TaxID=3364677 RepID=UPI0036A1BCB1